MMTGFLIALPFITLVTWLANGIRLIGKVSEGQPIGERPNTAILMVDLQTTFWDSNLFTERSMSDAQTAIIDELKSAKKQAFPVIAIRQEWSILSTKVLARLTMGGKAIAGTRGTEIAEPFTGFPDYVLTKRVQDSFETGELDQLLEKLDVGELRIVGLDARYCINKTAMAALGRGYKVTLIEKGILAAEPEQGRKALKTVSQAGAILK
ncbi:cysteine hydrolase family protein [Vibrio nigripulchritudo]|uniref:cysteine hydrolase n=1 Tax=Vibrio nigripulchritudo TaxID=28173 RepID=UPI00249041F7|nr:cysteine hydrolase [Vibrio nigripulchritudo]BDU39446.1 hypothetical protein TUMSATVNIG2_39150 [Vibrio nigripulchritudo]BDU45166.1 hypothetical protein TUMSATVNIG3_39640 [Vibrio nigripulchritudo]